MISSPSSIFALEQETVQKRLVRYLAVVKSNFKRAFFPSVSRGSEKIDG